MDKLYFCRLIFALAILAMVVAQPVIQGDNWSDGDDDDDDLDTLRRELNIADAYPIYADKRGFSMLARWRPFNLIGRQRTSIRDIGRAMAAATPYDVVSAETRALTRPSGQPLRWGK